MTETNASSDPSGSLAGGTVTFYSCPTTACASTTQLGTGIGRSNGQATYATSTLPVGTDYIEAVYGGSGTNLTGSTSNVVTQTVTSGSISTTSVLTSSANPSTYGSSVTFTDTVSASSGTPGGTVTFYSCTTSACSHQDLARDRDAQQLGQGHLGHLDACRWAPPTSRRSTGPRATTCGSTSNVVSQVVNALSTTSVLTSSANPSTYGSSVTFTDTVSASSGTPAGTVTFYSCTTNTCSTKTSLGTGTLNSSGKATLATSTPAGGHHLRRGGLRGLGQLLRLDVERGEPGGQRALDHLGPHLVGQPLDLRLLGHLHRHRVGLLGHAGRHGDLLQLHHLDLLAPRPRSGPGRSTARARPPWPPRRLPVGTTYVEAIYGASGNYCGSTSNVVTQVVNALSTTSVLTSSANPSTYGSSVTFTDTVSASSGTPGGTVTFYSCTTNTCRTKTSLGTGTLNSSGKATLATSTLPVGTTYVEAIYGASGNYGGSTSNVVTQVVNALSTTSVLTSSPNPSTYGSSVTFTDTVSASSGTPAGTVTFYSCTTNTCSTKTSLGTGTLNSSGKATYPPRACRWAPPTSRPIYGASGNYLGSTSNVVSQVVLNVPSVCAAGGYSDVIIGTPANPFLYGTNGNDLIYAFGASYWINGYGGNDCIDAGDGNNVIFDGNGNDGVSAGNGSDTVILGNGNDKVSLGNGSDGVETGDGNDTVTLGNGSQSEIIVGNGNDTVTVGTGSYNEVSLGSGTDTVTIQSPGSHDTIDGGHGNETIYLGSGTYNSYSGQAAPHQHLPPAQAARLLARDRGGLLPRHHHQLHGGVAMRHARSMSTQAPARRRPGRRRRPRARRSGVGVLHRFGVGQRARIDRDDEHGHPQCDGRDPVHTALPGRNRGREP